MADPVTDTIAEIERRLALINEIESLKEQLAEARRDAERVAWAMDNASQSGAFDHKPFPNIVRLEYVDEEDNPVQSDWCLYTSQPLCTPIEQYRIRLGNEKAPVLTPEARAIIDAAMAAEEQVT